ncbi:MAG: pentapeptide repeat-containing protein [Clostridium sp.]|uniref:pentapeptide repeat-containing protein n=1 Tax=Clostridium sp. TaxID=1506 RepID=UPI003F39AF9B
MYRDLRRSNCYNVEFSGSNFSFATMRGAHFKGCDFFDCNFNSTEFIGSNLKKSKFKKSTFENAIFEGVNLDGADFQDATFKNVIFVDTDVTVAKNMKLPEDIKIFEEMPELSISEDLEKAILSAMENDHIKKSRALDTKTGSINPISVMILLDNFTEKVLISGLKLMKDRMDKDFYTLSYIVKTIKDYGKMGII